MATRRRKFGRPFGKRRYRKLFVIAVEGAKTEPQYFKIFNNEQSVINLKCLRGKHKSAPSQVLERMEAYLTKEGLKGTDEAWLVVDRDQWQDEQLDQLYAWGKKKENYGFALSNPKFEYWLLLHFEDGAGVRSSRDCTERLQRYLPKYDKSIDARHFTSERISAAISRARQRDNSPSDGWSHSVGTTVYRLIEAIQASGTT